MTTQKIQCEHCSSIVRKDNFKQHQRTKKCQKAQEEKRQREERERQEKEKEIEEQKEILNSPVKESKESKQEKVECEWCGIKVIERNLERHIEKSKKCISIRMSMQHHLDYKCKPCGEKFTTQKELINHGDVCLRSKIDSLKDELYSVYEEIDVKLSEQKQYYEEKLKEREQQYRKELKEREQELKDELKEREQELKDELKSKDDFIKTLAKEPKYVTNTTNNNTFNLNNYFKGNNGIDFDEKLIENKIEQCRDMMLDTIDKHGFSDMKKIRDIKEKQIDLLCKDDKTKKWNVVNTDVSRKTYTVCKRDNDKVLTVKDPNGKMMKMIVDQMDRLNNRCYYKVLAENTHLQGSRFYELEDDCNILVKESLWDKIPTKAMLSEQELDDNITIVE